MEKFSTSSTHNVQEKTATAEHRLGMTLFLFTLTMVFASFIPEKTVGLWLLINSVFMIVFLGVLYFLWTKYKHDTVRYYSLQVYIMLMGISFFSIIPIFKLLLGTPYFGVLLTATFVLALCSHFFKKKTVKSFVNKNHKLLALILSLYTVVLMAAGVFLIGLMQRNEAPENTGVALLFYFVSTMLLVLAPMFLVRQEDVEKLKV